MRKVVVLCLVMLTVAIVWPMSVQAQRGSRSRVARTPAITHYGPVYFPNNIPGQAEYLARKQQNAIQKQMQQQQKMLKAMQKAQVKQPTATVTNPNGSNNPFARTTAAKKKRAVPTAKPVEAKTDEGKSEPKDEPAKNDQAKTPPATPATPPQTKK